MAHVVTSFVRERGKVLLVRRSDAVGTHRGKWAGVSGYVEERPDDAESDAFDAEADSRRELREEVGLTDADLELVRAGESLSVQDEEGDFQVHPFLFESETRAVTTNEELAAVEWVDPTEIRERETVTQLWETWRRVAPTVETVREDRSHGSTWIAARALEVLRDAAAEASGAGGADPNEVDDERARAGEEVVAVARRLREARPSMAAVANRVNRVLAEAPRAAECERPDPDAVREAAVDALEAGFAADAGAAATAADRLRDVDASTVATLSRSGTVRAALEELAPAELVVAESRPEREGVGVAEWAAEETDAAATLTTEAALPRALAARDVDAVLVGADSILPDGAVVNKTGTRVLALAAREAGIPAFAVAAADKIHSADGEGGPSGDGFESAEASPTEAVYDGDADVAVHAPTFEATPAALFDGVATEEGVLDAADVRERAERHAENAAWDERTID